MSSDSIKSENGVESKESERVHFTLFTTDNV